MVEIAGLAVEDVGVGRLALEGSKIRIVVGGAQSVALARMASIGSSLS